MQPFVVKFYSKDHPDLCARELHPLDVDEAVKFIYECQASDLYSRCEYDDRINIDLINTHEPK